MPPLFAMCGKECEKSLFCVPAVIRGWKRVTGVVVNSPPSGGILGPFHRPGGGLHPHGAGFHLPRASVLWRGQQAWSVEIRPLPVLLHAAVLHHTGHSGCNQPGYGGAQTRAGETTWSDGSFFFLVLLPVLFYYFIDWYEESSLATSLEVDIKVHTFLLLLD